MNQRLKTIVKYIKYYSPGPVKTYIQKKADKKLVEDGLKRYKEFKVSKEELREALSRIDFDRDIMLHTSLMNIGHVSGGAKEVINQIFERLDCDRHTLLVSALPYRGAFADYLTDDNVFDVRTAPIAMGVINQKIASRPDASRSIHPTHSVVAVGKDAEQYTGSHHLDPTPFGPNSPYFKVIKNRGSILLFGAEMNNITLIHAVEDFLGEEHPVKDIYRPRRYEVKCITTDNSPITVSTPVHNPRRFITRRDVMLEDGLKKGYVKQWKLGGGYIRQVDAYEYAKAYIEKLKQGKSQYGRCKKLSHNAKTDI